MRRGGAADDLFFSNRSFGAIAMPQFLSQLLYCARWMGTLLVLAVHATIQFVNFSGAAKIDFPPLAAAWRFVASFELGHQAVIGFFVMSGFLVGGAAINHLREDQPFLLEYFIHRFARIYLVLLPAILLTFVLDTLGRSVFAGAGVYELPFLQIHYSPLLIFTHALNLQGVLAPYYGTNGPLWSIGYEFWYYILFPAVLLPWGRAYPWRKVCRLSAATLLVIVLVTIRQGWFILGFLIWGMGALMVFPNRPLIRSASISLALNIVVVLALRTFISGETLQIHPSLLHVSDVISAAAFANLILTLRFSTARTWPLLEADIHRQLADFSFSVYAIHMPVLVFLRSALAWSIGSSWLRQSAAPAQWLALFFAMSVTLIFAFGFSRATEANTGAFRRQLRGFARRVDRAATASQFAAVKAQNSETAGISAKYDNRMSPRASNRPPVSARKRVKGER
jgi:peptidoglycan/LPS O-acetylase OafA/YrhL